MRDDNRPHADATQTCPNGAFIFRFLERARGVMFKRGIRGIRTSTFANNHTVSFYAVAIGPF